MAKRHTAARIAIPLTGYGIGYAYGKRKPSKKTAAELHRQNRIASRATLGNAAGATYLAFTPAGRRAWVNHGVTGIHFATGVYAGRTHANLNRIHPKPNTNQRNRVR